MVQARAFDDSESGGERLQLCLAQEPQRPTETTVKR